MRIGNRYYRSIWFEDPYTVAVIDQRFLPFQLKIAYWTRWEHAFHGIQDMQIRGAPLIGIAGACGLYLASLTKEAEKDTEDFLIRVANKLKTARPTAVNLHWCIDRLISRASKHIRAGKIEEVRTVFLWEIQELIKEDMEINRKIGEVGTELIRSLWLKKQQPVNILTHCNAGWIATVDYGTVTSVIYKASDENIPLHVWVSETRPRNQGARLTAWELSENNIPFTLIADNSSGLLMSEGKVDIVLVGADRVALNGDTANKIGTYMKAVCAQANNIPFYVALPPYTLDPTIKSGKEIPIEYRSEDEVLTIEGWDENRNLLTQLRITPHGVKALNPAFDVTPAKYITGFITPDGVLKPDQLPEWAEKLQVTTTRCIQ